MLFENTLLVLPAPVEEQVRVDAMPTAHFCHGSPAGTRFGNDAAFLLKRVHAPPNLPAPSLLDPNHNSGRVHLRSQADTYTLVRSLERIVRGSDGPDNGPSPHAYVEPATVQVKNHVF
jgi:hypothetical protein